jgi:putative peptidoglycan lipid II flippase
MFNVVMVLAVAMAFDDQLGSLERSLLLGIAIPFAALVQLLITGITWLLSGKRWRRSAIRVPEQTTEFFRRVAPSVIAAGIPQLKLIAATAIVSSSEAAVAWLYYANRLYELPLGIASVAIATVILPDIAASRRGDAQAFYAAQSRAYEIALGLALPAAAGFALLAKPIASALFEHGAFGTRDTMAVAAALTAICAGLPAHVLEKVFTAVSAAHDDTGTPMLTACCGLAAAIIGGLLLFPRFGFVGVAAAIAIAAWAAAALLGFVLHRRRWLQLDAQARRRLPRIIVACGTMSIVIVIAATALFPTAARAGASVVPVLILVTLGIVAYGATLRILGVAGFKELATMLRR